MALTRSTIFQEDCEQLAKADNLRVFVMTSPEGALVGFYALNSHSIDYAELPERFAKTRPGHGHIPTAYISMIGVDERFAGQGYGGDLLINALEWIAAAAENLGLAVVMLDVLNRGNPELVEKRRKL